MSNSQHPMSKFQGVAATLFFHLIPFGVGSGRGLEGRPKTGREGDDAARPSQAMRVKGISTNDPTACPSISPC